MAKDVVIVSYNENGFYQADFFKSAGDIPLEEWENIGAAPDSFMTFARNGSLEDALTRAQERWPDAILRNAEDDKNEWEDT